jgi:hypothetical protein
MIILIIAEKHFVGLLRLIDQRYPKELGLAIAQQFNKVGFGGRGPLTFR